MVEDEEQISNIVGSFYFEKFEFEKMRDTLITKIDKFQQIKTKQVRMFGLWWWQNLTDEEWNNFKHKLIQKEDIKS